MGTVFAIQLADPANEWSVEAMQAAAREAMHIAHDVERSCSRFDAHSELARLCAQPGLAVATSPLLLELLALSVAIAEASDGAFDPTVGDAMWRLGFDRAWQTQQRASGSPDARRLARPVERPVSWRDVHIDRAHGTVSLAAPLLLDLGAIAKGFAVDLMTSALPEALSCSIHAGGDVRCRGTHPDGRAWRVGVRDPVAPDALAAVAHFASGAICTSGSYERIGPTGAHHLLDPHTGQPVEGFRSVSVVAPTAVVADGLATAAFVLGPRRAEAWLEAQGVDALLIDDAAAHTVVRGANTTTWDHLA